VRRPLKLPAKAVVSAVVLLLVIVAALVTPLLPLDPAAQNLRATLKPPGTVTADGLRYLLGTDQLGRDLLARLLQGARVSLLIGFSALGIAVTVGTVLGLLAGYYGGWVDAIITAITETLMALPFILLAIAIIAAVGASLPVLILTLGLTGWVSFAKLVRARVFELREESYVVAAGALGARDPRVLLRHVLPNVAPILLVDGTLRLGALILSEAALSFLGLGVQPPTASWGSILAEGQVFIVAAPWIATLPGLALLITVLAINFLGDALRDMASPGG
jgi:peptide/nickel transport system permease protein